MVRTIWELGKASLGPTVPLLILTFWEEGPSTGSNQPCGASGAGENGSATDLAVCHPQKLVASQNALT